MTRERGQVLTPPPYERHTSLQALAWTGFQRRDPLAGDTLAEHTGDITDVPTLRRGGGLGSRGGPLLMLTRPVIPLEVLV